MSCACPDSNYSWLSRGRRSSWTRATSSWKRLGLTKKAEAPCFRQKSRSSVALLVLRIAMGMLRNSFSDFSSIKSTSRPFLMGIFKSSTIKSGKSALEAWSSRRKRINSPPLDTLCSRKSVPVLWSASNRRSWSSASSSAEIINRGALLMHWRSSDAKINEMPTSGPKVRKIVPIVTVIFPFMLFKMPTHETGAAEN
jgi:hypothetical protein